jgi:DNA-binding winged helix-turn-helix (wHTH) protein
LLAKAQRITEKESDILNYLSQHRNHVIKREAMLKELWGENDYFLGTKFRCVYYQDSEVSERRP